MQTKSLTIKCRLTDKNIITFNLVDGKYVSVTSHEYNPIKYLPLLILKMYTTRYNRI